MPPKKGSKKTRDKTKAPLFEDKVSLQELPTTRFAKKHEVIRYFHHRSHIERNLTLKKISCSLRYGSAYCNGKECTKRCLLSEIKKPWISGGYEEGLITDQCIQ